MMSEIFQEIMAFRVGPISKKCNVCNHGNALRMINTIINFTESKFLDYQAESGFQNKTQQQHWMSTSHSVAWVVGPN